MSIRCPQKVRFALCLVLALALLAPQIIQAQTMVIQPSELRAAMTKVTESRQKNIDQVNSFLSSKPVRSVLAESQIDTGTIQNAVTSLNNEDLAMLAQRTQAVQRNFAGGSMSNEQLTYVVVALATAVVILVIVH